MDKIFNIMAGAVAAIVEQRDEGIYIKGRSISPSKKEQIDGLMMQYIPQVRDDNGILTDIDINIVEEMYQGLDNLFNSLIKTYDYMGILYVLKLLDTCLKALIEDIARENQYESSSKAINTNDLECGIAFFPRVVCGWERNGRGRQHYNRIDNYLSNLLVVEYGQLGDMQAEHHFISRDLFKNSRNEENKYLKVAICALKNSSDFTLEQIEKEEIVRFNIKYTGDMNKDNLVIWNKIQEAGMNDVDIIVFPELMGNIETENYIRTRIKELKLEEREKLPAIIIQPTV